MPAPLSNFELVQIMRNDLLPFVETERKGHVSIARDQLEVLEQLGQAPGRFRVILGWTGEKPFGVHKDSGLVEHEFGVIVSHNRGLGILKGANLSIGRGDDPPLMSLCSDVRDRLRRLKFPDEITSVTLEYAGTDPVTLENNQALDAYQMTFRLKAVLPQPTYEDAPTLP